LFPQHKNVFATSTKYHFFLITLQISITIPKPATLEKVETYTDETTPRLEPKSYFLNEQAVILKRLLYRK